MILCSHMYIFRYFYCLEPAKYNGILLKTVTQFWEKENLAKNLKQAQLPKPDYFVQ